MFMHRDSEWGLGLVGISYTARSGWEDTCTSIHLEFFGEWKWTKHDSSNIVKHASSVLGSDHSHYMKHSQVNLETVKPKFVTAKQHKTFWT